MWGRKDGGRAQGQGFSPAQGQAGVQLSRRAVEAVRGHSSCQPPIYSKSLGCVALRPALGHSEQGPSSWQFGTALISSHPGGCALAWPPHPSTLSGKPRQERKEVGGRAGGIQGALLG